MFGLFKLLCFFCWQLCCLFVFYLQLLIAPCYLQTFSVDNCVVCSCSIYSFWLPPVISRPFLLTIVLSVRVLFTASDCPLLSPDFFFKLFEVRRWHKDRNEQTDICRDGEMERWQDGEMKWWKHGEMERLRDKVVERWRDGKRRDGHVYKKLIDLIGK